MAEQGLVPEPSQYPPLDDLYAGARPWSFPRLPYPRRQHGRAVMQRELAIPCASTHTGSSCVRARLPVAVAARAEHAHEDLRFGENLYLGAIHDGHRLASEVDGTSCRRPGAPGAARCRADYAIAIMLAELRVLKPIRMPFLVLVPQLLQPDAGPPLPLRSASASARAGSGRGPLDAGRNGRTFRARSFLKVVQRGSRSGPPKQGDRHLPE